MRLCLHLCRPLGEAQRTVGGARHDRRGRSGGGSRNGSVRLRQLSGRLGWLYQATILLRRHSMPQRLSLSLLLQRHSSNTLLQCAHPHLLLLLQKLSLGLMRRLLLGMRHGHLLSLNGINPLIFNPLPLLLLPSRILLRLPLCAFICLLIHVIKQPPAPSSRAEQARRGEAGGSSGWEGAEQVGLGLLVVVLRGVEKGGGAGGGGGWEHGRGRDWGGSAE
mmetsp:Transcript_26736/g.78985  ORF Transcript_26736/g.78985 Transcript_26736/m.78985 type:complete len:220 (+) Transcript_26736:190-849(+)